MKKIVQVFVLTLMLHSAHAQITKGQWLVGGNGSVSFHEQTSMDFSGTRITASPNGGYFLINKLAGGLRVELIAGTLYESDIQIAREFSYYLTPFLRYYILSKTSKLNPFADVGYFYGRQRAKGTTPDIYKETLTGFSATGGIAFFVHPKVALEGSIKYRENKAKSAPEDKSNSVEFNAGFQIHL